MASIGGALNSGLSSVLPGYGSEGPPPGVAGPATPGQPVVYDPGTGLYVNQITGAVSSDPAGQKVVQDPSLATQAARNLSVSQNFLSQLGTYGQQYNASLAKENSLGDKLNAVVAGTAPSVAGTQLEQGLSQIAQQQQSQAAGATGENAALARTNAAQNTAAAQVATNQAAAGVRAGETTAALGAEGTLLNNEARQATEMYGTGLGGAANFSGQAGADQANQVTATQAGGKNQLTTVGSVAGAAGSALGVTSDMDEKTNVKPADMDDFLSKISAATGGKGGIEYDYKHPDEPGQSPGKKVGVPAQAVKRSKVGAKIVKNDGGTLKMNHGELLGAIVGALSHLNKKIEAKHG